ncbi:MAG: polyamine aminopropyltransferase [Microcoleaceae cyanobacterium]
MAGSEIGSDIWLSDYLTAWDVYAHGISEILAYRKTPYQEMYVVNTGSYGKALVLDGKWQSSTGDEFIYHEALVHPVMIFHSQPKTVLILGGGEGATTREVLRWRSVEEVVMVDIDGEVVEACRQYLPEMHQNSFDDPRVELVIDDALNYIEATEQRWDIVISDLSEPIESGPSFKLFTKEYFEKIRSILKPDGFFVMQAGSTSIAQMKLHVRLAHTMTTIFSQTHSYSSHIPSFGEPWGFVIASSQPINSQPDPDTVDRLLAENTTGGLQMLDGMGLLGLLQQPAHLRASIAAETQVYTLAEPPVDFGRGIIRHQPG